MPQDHVETQLEPPGDGPKPKIALMGEFSAGKSTLANLLLGQGVSPVKVTATQLPPVWYSFGEPRAIRIGTDNRQTAVALDRLGEMTPHDTQAVRVFLDAEVLEFCDIIDMPGTSDPNMPRQVWENLLSLVDAVVWCTPATQAWRQSEVAIWEQMPEHLQARGLLLVTRMDKLLSDRDRARVVTRVRKEVDGLFRAVFPVSLLDATENRDNPEALQDSGIEPFLDELIELLEELRDQLPQDRDEDAGVMALAPEPDEAGEPAREAPPPAEATAAPTLVLHDRIAPEPALVLRPPVAPEPAPVLHDRIDPGRVHVLHDPAEAEAEADPGDETGDPAGDNVMVLPRRVMRDKSRRVRTRPVGSVSPV